MVASGTELQPELIAHDLCEVVTHLCLTVPRGRRRAGDLKEIEFLTLVLLQDHGTMIVGDIQRQLGVLPAQMSRVLRSLEMRERPLVVCRLNRGDKRKIDVCMTPAGEKALQEYRAARMRRIVEVVRDLTDEEQEELSRLLHRLHSKLSGGAEAKTP
jgi:DNA-binding MarR family transcriptional regulator